MRLNPALAASEIAGWRLVVGGHELSLKDAEDVTGTHTWFSWAFDDVPTALIDLLNDQEDLGQEVVVAMVESLNTPATGAPSIQGILQQGKTLTADTVGIGDADWLTSPAYTYEWISVDSSNAETPITGANNSTYELTSSEEEHGIKLKVTFTDDGGTSETLTSAVTDDMVLATGATRNLLWLGTMTVDVIPIGGINRYGYITNGNRGEVKPSRFSSGTEEFSITSIIYNPSSMNLAMHVRDSAVQPPTEEDTAAWKFVFYGEELPAADATYSGQAMICDASHITAITNWSGGETLTVSLKTPVNTPPTGAPSIQGILQQGETLTADIVGIGDADGLTSPAYAYEWFRVDSSDTETLIAGANSFNYDLTSSDVSNGIKLKVTVTDDGGTAESLTSAKTVDVVASGATRELLWLSTLTVGGGVGHNMNI